MRDKVIELKVLPETEKGKGDVVDYRIVLQNVLSGVDNGLTRNQMVERIKLLKSLKAAEKEWVVNFSDYRNILLLVRNARFMGVSENLITFVDDIGNAPDHTGIVLVSG